MNKDLVLAIDQGTTGTTVVAVNKNLEVVAKENREFPQIFPQPAWVEHNLDDIWKSTEATLAAVLANDAVDVDRIAAIGITNQRETVGLWARDTSEPLHNAIVWQCRRTAERCQALKDAGHEAEVKRRTGLVLDPYFSGTKLEWLLDNVPGARARAQANELAAGTIDTFLVWRLTGGLAHVTDVSNASRTMLFDLQEGDWSPALMDMLNIPQGILPEVRSSSEVYGHTKGVAGLPDGIPIAGMAGDQQSALFGQACFSPGDAKCTYGTGAFILVNTGDQIQHSDNGMLTTVAWKLGPDAPIQYAIEGSVFIAGAAIQWLRDGLGILQSAAESEAVAREVPDSKDVVFVPALTGLGAPYWNANARGVMTGLTRDVTRAHIVRATLEGIALQCMDVLDSMRQDTGSLAAIRVDGGAAANDLLMQMQADLLGQDIIRPVMLETTAAGAAFLAALGVGMFENVDAIRDSWQQDKKFKPEAPAAAEALKAKWKRAVPKA